MKSLVFTFHELEAHFKTRKTRRAAFSGFEKKLSRLLVNNSKEIKYFFCFLFSLFLDYNWIPKLAAILEKSLFCTFLFFFLIFIFFISWRLIILQYCSGFCHTLKWISHGFTCVPHPDPPLPPPPPPDPSGSSQCTRPEHLSHASNLGIL